MTDEQLSNEIWKPIKGFEGLYNVSNLGNVESLSGLISGHLKQHKEKSKGDYLKVKLNKNGKSYPKSVHRLVAIAFHGDPPKNAHCSHLNGVADDNRAVNLVWESCKDNNNRKAQHITERGDRAIKKHKSLIEAIREERCQYDSSNL